MNLKNNFSFIDYGVFIFLLLASSFIGLLFWYKDRKNLDHNEYLVGSHNLAIFPVVMSLSASFMSTNTLLGAPAEIYMLGSQFYVNMFAYFISVILAIYVFMPLYYELKLVSINKYLLRRFDSNAVRLTGSICFIMATVPYLGAVLYGPSLALNSVTPLSIFTSILLVGLICTFYTTIGGIKAVIWTDVIQCFFMFLGLFIVIIYSYFDNGSILEPFRVLDRNQRLIWFNGEFNIYRSDVFWSIFLGCLSGWTGIYCVKQTQIQRYCCLKSKKQAKLALWLHIPVTICIAYLAQWCGVIIFSKYHRCDPILMKQIEKYDQLMPYYVMETMGKIPGLPGIFVVCIFSGALSTLSSSYNALATVTWDDFFKRYYRNSSQKTVSRVTKIISAFYGLISVGIAFTIGRLGTVMQASQILAGGISGPLLGLFILGVFFPFVDYIAALWAMFVGFGTCLWIMIGAMINLRPIIQLPVSVDQCPIQVIDRYLSMDNQYSNRVYPFHVDVNNFTLPWNFKPEGMNQIYHISYWLVSTVGFILTLITGVLIGLIRSFFKYNKTLPDKKFVSHLVKSFYTLDTSNKNNFNLKIDKKLETNENKKNKTENVV